MKKTEFSTGTFQVVRARLDDNSVRALSGMVITVMTGTKDADLVVAVMGPANDRKAIADALLFARAGDLFYAARADATILERAAAALELAGREDEAAKLRERAVELEKLTEAALGEGTSWTSVP